MVVKKKPAPKKEAINVEEVENPTIAIENNTGETLYTVKLDSKRFESRTMQQAMSLILGSEGVVAKVTLEREV